MFNKHVFLHIFTTIRWHYVSQVHMFWPCLLPLSPQIQHHRSRETLYLCCLETGIGSSNPQTKLTLLSLTCHGYIKEMVLFWSQRSGATDEPLPAANLCIVDIHFSFRGLPVFHLHIRKVFSAYFLQSPLINWKGTRVAVDQFHLFADITVEAELRFSSLDSNFNKTLLLIRCCIAFPSSQSNFLKTPALVSMIVLNRFT